jgi:cytochrome c-type biogenesis protein CcmH
MTGFVLSAAALCLLVVALLLVPLLRAEALPAHAQRTRTALSIALALPLAAAGGYAYTGAWSGLLAAQAQTQAQTQATAPPVAADTSQQDMRDAPPAPGQAQAMVQHLAQRLQQQPDDAQGWRLLARSYESLGRFAEAEQAYRQLERLLPPSAELLTEHAVTLAMSLGQRLSGAPEALIERALALEPRNAQALALSGSAAFERGDYKRAAAVWRKVLAAAGVGVGGDAGLAASIEQSIRKAETLAVQAQER